MINSSGSGLCGEITSLKTGYMTAYNVIETMELVSVSFFISSIVILNTSTTAWEENGDGTRFGESDCGNPVRDQG